MATATAAKKKFPRKGANKTAAKNGSSSSNKSPSSETSNPSAKPSTESTAPTGSNSQSESPATKRRKQSDVVTIVQRQIQSAGKSGAETVLDQWEDVHQTAKIPGAEEWLEENAKDGETYRIVRARKPVSVKVETVTKRVLN